MVPFHLHFSNCFSPHFCFSVGVVTSILTVLEVYVVTRGRFFKMLLCYRYSLVVRNANWRSHNLYFSLFFSRYSTEANFLYNDGTHPVPGCIEGSQAVAGRDYWYVHRNLVPFCFMHSLRFTF